MALTEKRIARAQKPRRYGDGGGLWLKVGENGTKSWVFRYQRGDRERWMGLGSLDTLSLSDAREAAAAARKLLLNGIDPLDRRKAEKAERAAAAAAAAARKMTFSECALKFYEKKEASWSNAKHRAQFLATMEAYAFPIIGSLAVADIDTPTIIRLLEPHWKTKRETMGRVRGRIEAVLTWATLRGYRSGDNPARWRGHLDQDDHLGGHRRPVRHQPALPYGELPSLMTALRERDGSAARALEFLILTAARTGEVIGAKWPEFDLDVARWTVPAERMKARVEHEVPLSAPAVRLLRALPTEDGNPFVFIGGAAGLPLSNMSMLALLKRMDRTDIVPHGFRSTFRDWCAERTTFPREVAEAALAHANPNRVEATYLRGKMFLKRTRLMAAWAEYCYSPARPSDVVPMRRAAEG